MLFTAWQRLLADVWRLLRSRFVLVLAVAAAVGLLDGLGMALLLPLLALVGIGSVGDGTIATYVNAAFAALGLRPSLETVLGAIVALFLIQGVLVLAEGHMVASIEARYVSHWRQSLLERLLAASWAYLSRTRTGSLAYLVITETERLGRSFLLSVQLVVVAVITVVYGAISLAISPLFTAGLLACLAAMAALFFRFSSSTSYRTGHDYGTHVDELQALVTDFLSGAKLIKATAGEPFVLETLRPVHHRVERSYFGAVAIPYALKAVMELAGIVLFCSLIYVGVRFLDMNPAALLVLLAIFFRLVPRLYNAQYNIQLLVTYLPAFEKLERTMRELEQARESQPVTQRAQGLRECPDIELKGVTVTYGDRDALADVSLRIPARTTVAIVGPSGAGKSTLIDCLAGLVKPRKGTTEIGGAPIDAVDLRRWRSSIGYVGQETVLFYGTVRDIICQGRRLTDEAVRIAATQAHAHHFIEELPNGYDTVIGPKGVQLSGGQKQRLSLARALAGEPVVLILDEPTSALDHQSEAEIIRAIQELKGRKTIVVVSHRLSLVRHADSFLVLDAGCVVAVGPWERVHSSGFLRSDAAPVMTPGTTT